MNHTLAAVFGGLFGLAVLGTAIGCVELGQPPRGLRWTEHVWSDLRDGFKWILLRIFYPERLPQEEEVKPGTFEDWQGNTRSYSTGKTRLEQLEQWDKEHRKGWTMWCEEDQRWAPTEEVRREQVRQVLDDADKRAACTAMWCHCGAAEAGEKCRPDFVDVYTDPDMIKTTNFSGRPQNFSEYNAREHERHYP